MPRPRLTFADRLRYIRRRACAAIMSYIVLLIVLGWCLYLLLRVAGEIVLIAAIQIIRWGRP